MAPGAGSKFGAPMFEAEVFWKQIYCIEESACDIVETFQRPAQWFGAPFSDSTPPAVIRPPIVIRLPGNCALFPPSLRPKSLRVPGGVASPKLLGAESFVLSEQQYFVLDTATQSKNDKKR